MTEPCRCENGHCSVCHGGPCSNEAGNQKVLYVGLVCQGCAEQTESQYLVPSDHETCAECGFDHEYEPAQANNHHRLTIN